MFTPVSCSALTIANWVVGINLWGFGPPFVSEQGLRFRVVAARAALVSIQAETLIRRNTKLAT